MGAAGTREARRAWRVLAVATACVAPWGCAADGDAARSDAATAGAASAGASPEVTTSSALDDPALAQRPVALWFWAPG